VCQEKLRCDVLSSWVRYRPILYGSAGRLAPARYAAMLSAIVGAVDDSGTGTGIPPARAFNSASSRSFAAWAFRWSLPTD
jgi:hypothetical protein